MLRYLTYNNVNDICIKMNNVVAYNASNCHTIVLVGVYFTTNNKDSFYTIVVRSRSIDLSSICTELMHTF